MANKVARNDKFLPQVRVIALGFPEAVEVEAWQHPTFRAGKKMFAAYGRDDIGDVALGMRMTMARQAELLRDDRFFPTPYAAHQGWVSIRLTLKTDWSEIAVLLREAYSTVANKRMLKALGQSTDSERTAKRN